MDYYAAEATCQIRNNIGTKGRAAIEKVRTLFLTSMRIIALLVLEILLFHFNFIALKMLIRRLDIEQRMRYTMDQ